MNDAVIIIDKRESPTSQRPASSRKVAELLLAHDVSSVDLLNVLHYIGTNVNDRHAAQADPDWHALSPTDKRYAALRALFGFNTTAAFGSARLSAARNIAKAIAFVIETKEMELGYISGTSDSVEVLRAENEKLRQEVRDLKKDARAIAGIATAMTARKKGAEE